MEWISTLIQVVWKKIFSIEIPYFNVSFGGLFLGFFIASNLIFLLSILTKRNGD